MTEGKKGRGRPSSKKDTVGGNENSNTEDNINAENNMSNTNPTTNNNVENDIPDDKNAGTTTSSVNNETSNENTDVDNNAQKLKMKAPVSNESEIENETPPNDIDAEILNEINQAENQQDDIPKEFNPLDEVVKERGYTSSMVNNTTTQNPNSQPQQERIIPEPTYASASGASKPEVDESLINDIPLDAGNGGAGAGGGGANGGKSTGQGATTNTGKGGGGSAATPQDDVKTNNLAGKSPTEKRELVEKSADSILLAYKHYMPIPFIWAASYDGKKLEKLHKDDVINLNSPLKGTGIVFRQYYQDFNKKVEEAFIITEQEIEAIKAVLVPYLMENEIAMTTGQNLAFTLAQFLIGKVILAAQFFMQKQADMEGMKEMHEENKMLISKQIELQEEQIEQTRQQNELIREQNEYYRLQNSKQKQQPTAQQQAASRPNPNPAPQAQQTNNYSETEVTAAQNTSNTSQKTNVTVVNQEPVSQDDGQAVSDAKIESETVNTTTDDKKDEIIVTPTLDDVLNMEEEKEDGSEQTTDNNDIPN